MSTEAKRIALVAEQTVCITGSGRGGRVEPGAYQVIEIDGAEDRGVVYIQVAGKLVALSATAPKVTYARPGEPFSHPDLPAELTAGFVVGECGHRVAGSEWRAGFRICEHCS